MTSFLGGPLETLDRKELATILRALLDRYLIIVCGDCIETTDWIAETLIDLVSHRREVVFGSDFVTLAEHTQMITHEQSDYNAERMIFRSPSSAIQSVIQHAGNLRGWVIASDMSNFEQLKTSIKTENKCAVILKLQDGRLSLTLNGGCKSLSETSFEQKLLDKVVSETQVKMERITRVLRRAAHGKVSERLEKSLIDLHHEEERVRKSLFREHIQTFVHAAWRTLVILLRLRLLDGVGVKSVISNKILCQAIDYSSAPVSRILDFIKAEWKEDFRNAVEGGRKRTFGDRLESFWAT